MLEDAREHIANNVKSRVKNKRSRAWTQSTTGGGKRGGGAGKRRERKAQGEKAGEGDRRRHSADVQKRVRRERERQ